MVTTTNVRAAGARKEILRGCALGLAILALVATGATAKDKIKVGLILPSYDQIRWQNGDQPCFEKEVAKLGMTTAPSPRRCQRQCRRRRSTTC